MNEDEIIGAFINYIHTHPNEVNTISWMSDNLSLNIQPDKILYYQSKLENTGFVISNNMMGDTDLYFKMSDKGNIELGLKTYPEHLKEEKLIKAQQEYASNLHLTQLEEQVELLQKTLNDYEKNKTIINTQVTIAKISAGISIAVLIASILLWLFPRVPR
jgi:hypothetical protein